MIVILSPAKIFKEYDEDQLLDYKPLTYEAQTRMLAQRLCSYQVDELEKLMKISKEIAQLNQIRYRCFEQSNQKGYHAADYFYGEAFKGLDAPSLSEEARAFMQEHVRILSGLYGCINALDVILPYRLEMGTKFSEDKKDTLYALWKPLLTEHILRELEATKGEKVLINLASEEYSKAIDLKKVAKTYPVITMHFKVKKNDQYKVVGIYAKKARGLMARAICEAQIQTIEELKQFSKDGYRYHEALSTPTDFVFVLES